MKNIILIGMPASGKSTIGKLLSKKIDYKYFDTDIYLEEKENKKIKDIFFEKGEKYFRDLETKYLKEVSQINKSVICTGGGVIKKNDNITIMKKNGIIIFLDREIEDIIKENHTNRPLLVNVNNVYEIYKERIKFYIEYADIIIKNNDTLEKITEKIYLELKNKKII